MAGHWRDWGSLLVCTHCSMTRSKLFMSSLNSPIKLLLTVPPLGISFPNFNHQLICNSVALMWNDSPSISILWLHTFHPGLSLFLYISVSFTGQQSLWSLELCLSYLQCLTCSKWVISPCWTNSHDPCSPHLWRSWFIFQTDNKFKYHKCHKSQINS